jgi:glycosyltransferase involved in cell wall biosynthesis
LNSSNQPTLCLIHEAVSRDSAIAKVALQQVRTALAAGWNVSVVAKVLDESLREQVTWLPLTVPRRSFFLKWTTARHFIRKAIGGRKFDVIHAHQPQVADLADVFQCHFLTRVAYERKCLEQRRGFRPRLIRLQQQGVLYAEDRRYRRWNPKTHMLFCSELLRQEFARLYGMPPSEEVLVNPCPPINFPTPDQRRAARQKLVGDFPGVVLGYIGGLQERKGYKRLLAALPGKTDVFLLMAGLYTQGFADPALAGRMKSVGLVNDVAEFYAACDALVVPSHFDPCPLVVFEAAARGTPVIATEGVGNLHNLLENDAGLSWHPQADLAELVRRCAAQRDRFCAGAQRMAQALSEERQGQRLIAVYDEALRRKRNH